MNRFKKYKTPMVLILGIAVLMGLSGGLFSTSQQGTADKNSQTDLAQLADIDIPCLVPNVKLVRHVHSYLEIFIDGEKFNIPQDIGTKGCHRALHVHGDDDPGVIHVEAQDSRAYTLGDFFTVWGKIFNNQQILDYKADGERGIIITVNNEPSEEYERLVLEDKQTIRIDYGLFVTSTDLGVDGGIDSSVDSGPDSDVQIFEAQLNEGKWNIVE